jgi:pimeloyl-ACP methyl ester carboxylesterase
MLNYEAVVTCDAALVPRPLCIVGRGMGSLAARMAAHRLELDALVLVDPWPAEGSPGLQATGKRPESALALEECRRGISLEPVSAPTLEVEGEADPQAVAAWARSASASAT